MYKWVEINLDAIVNNYQKVREYVSPGTKILGVVKADAYGHGLLEVARELEGQGIDYLGVTEIIEGIQLRDAGISTPILIFTPFLPEDIYYLQEYDLTISLSDLEMVKLIKEKELEVKVHLKIETGLGRTGLKISQLGQLSQLLKDTPNIKIEGAYTHLATSMWANSSFALKQSREFLGAVKYLEGQGITISLKHICNSTALIKFPDMHFDMVRAGNILYGQELINGRDFGGDLKNAWSLKAQVISLNQLPKGHSIGYERTSILKRDTKTALIPIGFFHGFSVEPIPRPKGFLDFFKVLAKVILRFLNHSRVKVFAIINEKRVPVIGKIGMQLTILDVTDLPEIKTGDTVELPGRRTNISPAIPKVFIKDNKPVKVRRIMEKYEEVAVAAAK